MGIKGNTRRAALAETTWEQETLMLIHDAEEEKRRAERRVESAKQDVQKCVVEVQASMLR